MIKINKQLIQRIIEKIFTTDISFSGNGYEYPPMFVWYKISSKVIENGWKKFLLKKEYFYPGVYLHIPFCVTKCLFCQFFSVPLINNSEIDRYLSYLEKEVKIYSNILRNIKWRTLYIGGGTPSILNVRQLDRLFCKILYKYFDFSKCIQVAFEASPSTLSYQKLQLLKKYKVNRLTIGVQTLDSKVIKICNRTQTNKAIFQAYRHARRVGIDYINIDLMAGLPGQTIDSFQKSLVQILKLQPDIIHVNPFHPSSPTRFFREKNFYSQEDIRRRNQMIQLNRKIESKIGGYKHEYELPLSNFEGRNIQLVDQIQYNSAYLGLGCSASSHINNYYRYINYNNLHKYYNALDRNKLPVFLGYKLKKIYEMTYYLIANLRYKGISKYLFKKLFNKDIQEIFADQICLLEKKKKIKNTPDYIISTMRDTYDYLFHSIIFYTPEIIKKCEKRLKGFVSFYKNKMYRFLKES